MFIYLLLLTFMMVSFLTVQVDFIGLFTHNNPGNLSNQMSKIRFFFQVEFLCSVTLNLTFTFKYDYPFKFGFLAHLSRRLMGELIVYQSLCRPSIRQHFQTSSPLKPRGQLNSNFIWRLLRTQEQKFVQMVLVT